MKQAKKITDKPGKKRGIIIPTGPAPILTPDEETLNTIRGLGRMLCTLEEMAGFLKVGRSTVEKFVKKPEVQAALESGRADGKISLRRTQFRLAETQPSVAIHLGKVYLDQGDKRSVEISGPGGGPVEFAHLSNEELAARIAAFEAKNAEPDGAD